MEPSKVIAESGPIIQEQWSLSAAVGCSYWQETSDSRGSVNEAVPVPGNAIELQAATTEGTFLCLDCDMPLNIEMKKDHLLVCKSRQPIEDVDCIPNNKPLSTAIAAGLPTSAELTTEAGLPTAAELTNDAGLPTAVLATVTDAGIVVTSSDGTMQLVQSVITNNTAATVVESPPPPTPPTQLTEHFLNAPIITRPNPCPQVRVFYQPNGRQCKVYTDEVENYKCPICLYTTTTTANLNSHKCVPPSEKLKCSECDFVADVQSSLSRHMVIHRKSPRSLSEFTIVCPKQMDKFIEKRLSSVYGEMFFCTECNYTSSTYVTIKYHTQKHTQSNPYKCDQCNFSCKLELNLKNHKLMHEIDSTPLVVSEKKTSKRRKLLDGEEEEDEGLERRKKMKMRLKPVNCRLCNHVFKNGVEDPNEHIDFHLKIDADEMSFKCMVCELTCVNLDETRDHVRSSHLRYWPVKCTKCEYTCDRLSKMAVHQRTHKFVTFSCDQCSFECKLETNMKQHIKQEHSRRKKKKKKVGRPSKVARKFEKEARKNGADNNVKAAAAAPAPIMLKCTKCEFVTATKVTFEAHLKTHQTNTRYACDLCEYTCKLARNFEHHKLTHVEKEARKSKSKGKS